MGRFLHIFLYILATTALAHSIGDAAEQAYSPTSFNATGKMEMTGKTSMTQETKVSGKRVGAC